MTEKLRQIAGYGIGTLVAVSCVFIGKVVAVDVPHSPLGIVASMLQKAPVASGRILSVAAVDPEAITATDPLLAATAADRSPTPVVAKQRNLHHLVMNEQGAVTGQLHVAEYAFGDATDEVVPAGNTAVRLISHCTTTYEAMTDLNGAFELSSVTPGVYTLIADGPQGVLAIRVSVEANDIFPSSELNALLVPNIDAQYVRSVINERLPSETKLPEYMMFDRVELPDAPLPPPLATEVSATTKQTQDYELTGRVYRLNPMSGEAIPVTETSAELIRNGRGVQPVSFQTDGQCEVSTLEAEHYSFVAVGVDGICAIGIEAGGCGGPDYGAPIDGYAGGCCTEMAVVPYDDCGVIVEEPYVEEVPCCEEEYGYAGSQGGCCGGGGSGGGGGGLGSLLGLAGLAGLAAFIDDDNDNPVPPPPIETVFQFAF